MGVTTRYGRCPPAPPDGFTAPIETSEISANPEPWVRLCWKGDNPLRFARSTQGNRFDPLPAPWDGTHVLYVGTSLETSIAEALLRWHGEIIPGQRLLLPRSSVKDRRVARLLPKRPLSVIDATGLGRASIEAAITRVLERPEHADWRTRPKPVADDIFDCSPAEYAVTRQWAAWFRTQRPDAHGIMWVSRQYDIGRCIVLFEDRCRGVLRRTARSVPLYTRGSPEAAVLDDMLARLGWGVDV